ncbi:hypothetical protein DICVIV_02191 [Dictyocaulus viviparus]|uniref:Uncharacterized protein n=1 Tax=Dictyocaulus viviparus TaxID=29172 RepID=A0A0D8Y4K6_DICVI|nr:hypothetical protein DICVIV_02191 [Dictyocaulus viviparus]
MKIIREFELLTTSQFIEVVFNLSSRLDLLETVLSSSDARQDENGYIGLPANKNAKRVILEQQAQPSKEQQVATMGYNPYAYWPYYGRA